MPNLFVQTNILYFNSLSTKSGFFIDSDPRSKTLRNDFYRPDGFSYEPGDGSVITTSSLMPGIKWAYEFNRQPENTHPVKFLEICSKYNQRENIFDELDDYKHRNVSKNSYIGVDCTCRGTENSPRSGKSCDHLSLLSDTRVAEFVLRSAIDKRVGIVGEKFAAMTEEQLQEYVGKCTMFYPKDIKTNPSETEISIKENESQQKDV